MNSRSTKRGYCSKCDVKLETENTYKKSNGYQGRTSICKSCITKKAVSYDKENLDAAKKRQQRYYQNKGKEIYQRRKEWHVEYGKRPERVLSNLSRVAARRAVMTVTLNPVEECWVDFYYMEAKRLTEETGVKHQVDHIKPISKGGLHAPWNLQVLTADENLRKGAKWHSEAA